MQLNGYFMRKKQSFSYPFIKDTIKDTLDKNTVVAMLAISLDRLRSGEFHDVVFADILYTAAKKYIDIQ